MIVLIFMRLSLYYLPYCYFPSVIIHVTIVTNTTEEDYRKKIQAVFDSAKTFGQGSRAQPDFTKWRVNVDCSSIEKNYETDSRCQTSSGIKAYTFNTKNTDGSGPRGYDSKDSTANMHFCKIFWGYKQLDDRINEWKNSKNWAEKYNMDYYRNKGKPCYFGVRQTYLLIYIQGFIILHEMMHANVITYQPNGNQHIQDLNMKIYEYKQNPNDRFYKKKLVSVDVYGAQNCKILARTSRKNIVSDITKNGQFKLFKKNRVHCVLIQ